MNLIRSKNTTVCRLGLRAVGRSKTGGGGSSNGVGKICSSWLEKGYLICNHPPCLLDSNSPGPNYVRVFWWEKFRTYLIFFVPFKKWRRSSNVMESVRQKVIFPIERGIHIEWHFMSDNTGNCNENFVTCAQGSIEIIRHFWAFHPIFRFLFWLTKVTKNENITQ